MRRPKNGYGNGFRIQYTYNDDDRVTVKTYSGTTPSTVTYIYDKIGNTLVMRFTYDAQGNPVTMT